jgi:hypothetical protein
MQVSLHSGTGKIVADGKEQTFSAGEKVTVPLGGPSGADAVGPPSSPEPLSEQERDNICQLTGDQCPAESTQSVARSPTPVPSATGTATATLTPTRTATTTPTATNTLFYKTLTPSNTPTSALTLLSTSTRTNTPRPTWTPGGSKPTRTPTNTPTRTPTNTFTNTPTNTFTNTPTNTFTNTPVPGGPCAPAVASAGALTNVPATELHMNITNNSGSAITIDSIHIEWVKAPPSQLVSVITLSAANTLFNAADPDSPSDLPSELSWAGGADLSIPGSATRPLVIEYSNTLQTGDYVVKIDFAAPLNCYVQSSLTLP